MDEIFLLVKVSGQRPADHSGTIGSSRKVSCQFDSGYIQCLIVQQFSVFIPYKKAVKIIDSTNIILYKMICILACSNSGAQK